jgi:caspase domain-containing protein
MPTTAEPSPGRRLALVIATGSYLDPALAKLRAPGRDATELADVLGDEAIGGFEVETVLDAPAEALRRQIARFCAGVGPHDLALIYLSCHGVLDDRGRLYYASADTDRALLSATAVPAAWLNEQLEDCRSRRQILVLDCCHSGAFAKGAKGEGELALRDRFEGRGRVVLTGSRGTEYSFEHGDVVGDGISSVFTGALVEGLRSGEADRDGDGLVTVGELYDYAYETVRGKEARQTPTLWTYGAEGDLPVAHSPRGVIVEPAPLPDELVALLESSRPRLRESAVAELAELLEGSDPGRALSAREALERVAAEDVPSVAAAARTALGGAPPATAAATKEAAAPPAKPPPPPAGKPPGSTRPPRPTPTGSSHSRRRLIGIVLGAAALLLIAIGIVLSGGGGSGPQTFDLGGSPRGVAVSGGAWIARYGAGSVTRIDPSSNQEKIPVGARPGKIAAGANTVWVSYEDGRMLAQIDPEGPEVTKRIAFGERCNCTVTELMIGDGRLWVSSADNGTITSFDPQTGREAGEPWEIPGFEGKFALDSNAIWAVGTNGDEGQLTRFDIRREDEKPKLSEPGAYFAGVAYGDERVWIADSRRNVVISFVTRTEATNEIHVNSGIYEDDIAFADGSVLAWDPVRGILTQIDAGSETISERQHVSGFTQENDGNELHSDLAVGDEYAWVTDPAKGMVHKLSY